MSGLKILLPTKMTPNPYIFQLIRSLQAHSDVDVVQHGLPWLKDTNYRFDIVHIQWPEVLFNWQSIKKEDLNFMKKRIVSWKKQNTKLVSTVHNEFPHSGPSAISRDLYQEIYSNSDAIIHFGEESKKYTTDTYGLKEEIQYIIPHGNYTYFNNRISKADARNLLDIEENRFMVLSLGTIRNSDEMQTLTKVAGFLDKYNGLLFVAGRHVKFTKKSVNYYKVQLPFQMKKNIFIESKFIPDDEIQIYLNAADVLFIPRVKTLNSGNVALGLTFGKIVVGNDYGVVGEELKKLGNPVFSHEIESSLENAINESYKHLTLGTDYKNKEYAKKHLNWNSIAEKHIAVYLV